MKINSYNIENPIEAKILLMLGLCGAKPSEFSFETHNSLYGTDKKTRVIHWDYEPIDKSALDYVKTILYWNDNCVVEFKPVLKENLINKALWLYEVRIENRSDETIGE